MTRVDPRGPAAVVPPRARGRVLGSVAGAGVSGVLGLLLVVVVTHGLDVADAGRVLTGVAVLTVVTAGCCLGVDTGLIWLLPRTPDAGSRRVAVRSGVRRALFMAVLTAALVAACAKPLAALLFPGPHGFALTLVTAVAVPALVASTVLVAAVRGLDRLPAYLVLQFGALPAGRVLGAGLAVTAGGAAASTLAGWAAVAVVTALLAAVVVLRVTRGGTRPAVRSERAVARRLWAFCRPRAVSSLIDASAGWVGVLLVAALAGSAEAARFGTVSRCALAGLLVMQAVRVATATQFSQLLRRGDTAEVGALYRASTRWVVTVSWPVFGVVAAYASTVLGVFGAQYRDAAGAMVVVAAAMLVNTGCGNAQSVLLMSGDSRRHLVATTTGLLVTVTGAVAFVPSHGVLAAALAWAGGIVVENLLVVWWVRTRLHVGLLDRQTVALLALLLLAVAPTVVVVRLAAGPGATSLLFAVVTAFSVLTLGLLAMPREPGRPAAGGPTWS